MQLINISLLLAASLASTAQARHFANAHLHPRSYDNTTHVSTSTVVVSPIPVSSVPLGTGISASVGNTTTTRVSNATLTYTMGYGSSTTVVTTTVMRTETLTRSHTVYATMSAGGAVESDVDGNNNMASSAGPGMEEPTTTITDRSTTTRTITVESLGPSGGAGLPGQSADSMGNGYESPASNVAGEGGSGSGCAALATVTETIRSTVTVTASPYAGGMPIASDVSPEASVSEDTGFVSSSTSNLPILTTSPTAPYGNGTSTHSTKTKKKCASSGFLTSTKPSAASSAYKRS